jgi:DNA-binding transcriptional ArsR family regulator
MDLGKLINQEFIKGSEEGERGRSKVKDLWGFEHEPFSGEEPPREIFVGREDEVARLARVLGRSVMGLRELIACIGPVTSGVTATLRIVYEALQESERVEGTYLVGTELLETYERKEDDEEYLESYFDVFLRETDFINIQYVIIDEADAVADYLQDFIRRIHEAAGAFKQHPAIVVGLHLSGWLSLPSEFREQIADQIWLGPLPEEEVVEILLKHLAWAKGKTAVEPFHEKALWRLAQRSLGLPGLAIKLARLVLHESLAREASPVDAALIDEVANAYGFGAAEAVTRSELSEDQTRTVVVHHIVKRPMGISSSGLASVTQISRTTVNYHLAVMEEQGVLAKQRKGRKVLYAPTDVSRPALEILVLKSIAPGMGVSTWLKEA